MGEETEDVCSIRNMRSALQHWGLGNSRRQKSAPRSVEARSGAAALARELGEQG